MSKKNLNYFIFSVFLFLPFLVFADSGFPEPPLIISRSEWGADESIRTWQDEYVFQEIAGNASGTPRLVNPHIDKIVIHHTASKELIPDSDGSGRYSAMIRNIYRYHAFNAQWEDAGGAQKGFGDIGYHYLIDPNGNIYQGRSGSNGVIGAHAYGFNTGTIGISLLGTYGANVGGVNISHPISSTTLDSLARLVGWLSANNSLDINQRTKVCGLDRNGNEKCYVDYGVVGHRDVGSTQCPGNELHALLPELRKMAFGYSSIFRNYVYQEANGGKYYAFSSGFRYDYASLDEFVKSGKTYTKIAKIPQSQIFSFLANRAVFADGTLIRPVNENTIYLIENGQRRAFGISYQQFIDLGFKGSGVIIIDAGELEKYPLGPEIKFAQDSEVLKIKNDSKVFLAKNGRLRWVVSLDVFGANNLSWGKLKELDKSSFDTYLIGKPLSYPVGSLVRAKNEPTVYKIDNNENLRPITSLLHFNSLGLHWENVRETESDSLSFLTISDPLDFPKGALLQKQGDPKVYQMAENGLLNWIKSLAEFNKLKLNWANILVLSASEWGVHFGQPAIQDAPVSNNQPAPTSPVSNNQTPISTTIKDQEPWIRVGIYQVSTSQNTVEVAASGNYKVCNLIINQCVEKTKDQITSNVISVETNLKFTPADDSVIMQVLSYKDSPAWKPELNYNQFRGAIEIKENWVINEIKLEDYLKGVSETVQGESMDYLKTMAVAARTYAYNHYKNGGKYPGKPYHIINTSSDQLYKGYGREILASDIVKAVNETRGEIAIYGSKPIVAAYSSGAPEIQTSGTRSACSVWGGKFCESDYDYLDGGAKDPAGSSYYLQSCGAGNHCAGLSAAGAKVLGKTGTSYVDILKYYYKGISVEKIY